MTRDEAIAQGLQRVLQGVLEVQEVAVLLGVSDALAALVGPGVVVSAEPEGLVVRGVDPAGLERAGAIRDRAAVEACGDPGARLFPPTPGSWYSARIRAGAATPAVSAELSAAAAFLEWAMRLAAAAAGQLLAVDAAVQAGLLLDRAVALTALVGDPTVRIALATPRGQARRVVVEFLGLHPPAAATVADLTARGFSVREYAPRTYTLELPHP